MATKTAKKKQDKSTVDLIKNKVKNINEFALKTSNEVVEETLVTGEQWQNLFAKTLRKGTVLFGKQQDLMFSGLEMLKDQYNYGNKRFWKLLSSKPNNSKTPKPTAKKTKATAKVKKSVDEITEAALNTGKAVKKAVKPLMVRKTTTSKASENVAVAPKKGVNPTKTVKSNLTVIEGIGPKIQELLNNAGIISFDQLATAKPASLKKVLKDAGSRFQMHDPSTWAAQAKLAAAGKMEELKVLQVELKGGK